MIGRHLIAEYILVLGGAPAVDPCSTFVRSFAAVRATFDMILKHLDYFLQLSLRMRGLKFAQISETDTETFVMKMRSARSVSRSGIRSEYQSAMFTCGF